MKKSKSNDKLTIAKLPNIKIAGNELHILNSAKEFSNTIVSLINQAKWRIYVTALYLENDQTGQRFLQTLYQKKQENPQLDIAIIVDFHRSRRGRFGDKQSITNADWYAKLAQDQRLKFNIYGLPVKNRELFGVMHLKGFIIDNTLIYSGASINNVYFDYHNRYRQDRYVIFNNCKLADSFVNLIQKIINENSAIIKLNQNISLTSRIIKKIVRQSIPMLKKITYDFEDDLSHTLCVSPIVGIGQNNLLNTIISSLVNIAKQEIILYTPYFNPPPILKKLLINALKKNIKIVLIIGDKKASDFYIYEKEKFNLTGVLPYLYELQLLDFMHKNQLSIANGLLNIYLWSHEKNSYHAKGISIDQQYHLLTGHNFNARAWKLDLENGILIQDPQKVLIEKFSEEYQFILANTQKIYDINQLENSKNYPLPAKKVLNRLKRIRADKILKKLM